MKLQNQIIHQTDDYKLVKKLTPITQLQEKQIKSINEQTDAIKAIEMDPTTSITQNMFDGIKYNND